MSRLASLITKNLNPGIFIEYLPKLSTEAEEGKAINMASSEPEWTSQIIKYLKNGELPKNKDEARKVKIRASRYLFLSDTLYKRSLTLPLLKCLSEEKTDYVLQEIHEGICGNHSGGWAMAHEVIKAEYYWPSMQKDASLLSRKCDKCQRFVNP